MRSQSVKMSKGGSLDHLKPCAARTSTPPEVRTLLLSSHGLPRVEEALQNVRVDLEGAKARREKAHERKGKDSTTKDSGSRHHHHLHLDFYL